MVFCDFMPKNGIQNQFVTQVQPHSDLNELSVLKSFYDWRAYHSNERVLEKCSGIGANDDALFDPK